jgi:alkyl hydroperoxide reductase subunit AhpC
MIQHHAPDFKAMAMMPPNKIMDEISLSDYTSKGKWVVLFYFPLTFTFVCPTEIISFSDRQPEFEAINCQLIAASCDSTQSHIAWSNLPRNEGGLGDMKIPIISDFNKQIARAYGVLLPDGVPLRGTFIISPSGKI